jgi:hypothetical protein
MKPSRSIFLAPLLCLGLLGAIEVERRTQLEPKDAEPYHARASAAVRAAARSVSVDGQPWSARQVEVPEAAVKLLGNAEALRLHFKGRLQAHDCSADLLVVHCQDSRDMTGHYPPVCYPGNGHTLVSTDLTQQARTPEGLTVPYVEYGFEKEVAGRPSKICIYNFFVVPGRGVVRDIQDVRDAAEDYQRRFFGATQLQLVLSAELPPSWREHIFQAMLDANAPLLHALNSAEVPAQ